MIHVNVGHAKIRQLGSEISDFRAPFVAEGLLKREIPLLCVSTLLISLDGEYALTQTAIGARFRYLHGWTAREHECRVDVVERPLSRSLDEWEERRCKRRRDSSLFDPCQTIAGSENEAIGELQSQADARRKVVLLQIPRRSGKTVLPEVIQLLRLQIENGPLVINNGGWEIQRVANAAIQSQPPRCLEIVLKEEFPDFGTRFQCLSLHVNAEILHLPEKKRCKGIAGTCNGSACGRQITGQNVTELERARWVRRLQDAEIFETPVCTDFQAVPAAQP